MIEIDEIKIFASVGSAFGGTVRSAKRNLVLVEKRVVASKY
jgi:hypothetical protein